MALGGSGLGGLGSSLGSGGGLGAGVGGGFLGVQNGALGWLMKGVGVLRSSNTSLTQVLQQLLNNAGLGAASTAIQDAFKQRRSMGSVVKATITKRSQALPMQRAAGSTPGGAVNVKVTIGTWTETPTSFTLLMVAPQTNLSDPTTYIQTGGTWPAGASDVPISVTAPKSAGLYTGLVVVRGSGGSLTYSAPLYLRLIGAQSTSSVQPFRPLPQAVSEAPSYDRDRGRNEHGITFGEASRVIRRTAGAKPGYRFG